MKITSILLLSIATFFASCSKSYDNLKEGLYADIETAKGNMIVKLEFEKVPNTVANFVNKEAYYNNASKKAKNDYFIVRDFFTNKKIEVLSRGQIINFDDKESFEARIVEMNGKNYFLKGFCFHPQSAQKYILDEIKVYKKNPDLDFEEFLMRLNKMRYKLEQYKHIKPEHIYTNDNKLKL
jgi:hypothetical protein